MKIVYGKSANGNFAVGYEGDSTWRVCEVPGDCYDFFDEREIELDEGEFQRIEHLREKLLKEEI